ncbi:MAG: ATP-binding cassette domain-containing protein, partial [Lachnospiraceae bacterium]|nr:ATP-binding cassette domain-containing protein [Lachnospiraceae bacterium]
MDILQVSNLKKYYVTGEIVVKALDGINLHVKKGEFLAIVGTSGSGKSTLLNMLGGLDVPTEGEIVIDGQNISGLKKDELTILRRRK